MNKDRLTLIFFGFIISFSLFETLPKFFPSLLGLIENTDRIQEPDYHLEEPKKQLLKKPTFQNSKDWGSDIFYDRSEKYYSWFRLTGITQFQNTYKAIVNGEILNEMDRVRGFTVTEISKKKVVLKRNKYLVTLKMEE